MSVISPFARPLAALAVLLSPTAALSVPLTIVPPDELTLNGSAIAEGTFNLTGLIAYSDGAGPTAGATVTETVILDPSDSTDDIVKFAIIGDTTPEELGTDLIPADAEVLRLTGFFEPTVPTVIPSTAAFEIIVGVLTLDNGSSVALGVDNFTYYLPLDTSGMFPQVTDVGMDADRTSLGDNSDTFFAAGTSLDVTNMTSIGVLLDNGVDNPWWVVPSASPLFAFEPPPPGGMMPNCPPPTIVTTQRHGSTTTRIIPGPCDPMPPTGVSEPGAGVLLAVGAGLLIGATLRRRRREVA